MYTLIEKDFYLIFFKLIIDYLDILFKNLTMLLYNLSSNVFFFLLFVSSFFLSRLIDVFYIFLICTYIRIYIITLNKVINIIINVIILKQRKE